MPKNKAKNRKNNKKIKARKQREVAGLILAAVGLFLFMCMFLSSTGLLGRAIKPVMYGLFGLSAYVIPLLISGIGGAIIMLDKKKLNKGKISVLLIFIFVLMNLLHVVAIRLFDTSSYGNFILSGYNVGMQIKGQGALSAIMTYPVWKLIGTSGSLIFYSCVTLVLLVIFTNMSIKKVGDDVKDKIEDTKTYLENRREKQEKKREEKEQRRLEKEKENQLYMDKIEEKEEGTPDIEPELKTQEFIERDYSFLGGLRREKNKRPSINNVLEPEPAEEETAKDNETVKDFKVESASSDEPARGIKRLETPPQSFSIFSAPLGSGEGKTVPKDAPGAKVISINDKPKYKPAFEMKATEQGFLHLLKEPQMDMVGGNKQELEEKSNILESTLESFNVKAKVVNITCGPTITRYELQPAHGVKINRILSLQDDIKMALAAKDIRIEAPIPGKNAVGIEIPNDNIRTVYLREVLESDAFRSHKSKLAFALGIDIDGNSVVADLKKMPHLLIAGTTGSGKSVCVNNIILSLLYNTTPKETKMIMIDPKMVEMTSYNDLPHMLIPVVTDSNKAAGALRWALNEMEMRYTLFSKSGVKELSTYNANVDNEEDKKPAIVVFVDELADLMMVAKAEVEEIICRIAQKGRAAGIHLVLATQRPSVNVITGVIKANIPSRIACHVVSPIDSRTILDSVGAERLLGRGDMLFHPNGEGAPKRLQGAFVSEEEIKEITDFIKENATADYSEDVLKEIEKNANAVMGLGTDEDSFHDELLPEAVKTVLNLNEASTSLLQRKMRLGYARAARIMDEMEEMGIIGPQNGSKRRDVLISFEDYERMFGEGN